jgi:hypothetical protein
VPQGTPTTVTPPPSSPAEPSGPSAAKPLRADARRNQARVLETAEAVFAAKGTAASTEEIARQAGVGIGTVFSTVRDVFRATGALICLGRWLHRVPACQRRHGSSTSTASQHPNPARVGACHYPSEMASASRATPRRMAGSPRPP